MTAPRPISPLPWKYKKGHLIVDAKGACVQNPETGEFDSPTDEGYAVHCANSYPALVAALKEMAENHCPGPVGPCPPDDDHKYYCEHSKARKVLRAAGEL